MKRLLTTFLLSSTFVLAAPSGSKPVIVQMFEWTWNSVAAECTNFLGPAGYGFVQGQHPFFSPRLTNAYLFTLPQ